MPIAIRPTDLPELRAELAAQMHEPHTIGRMWPEPSAGNREAEEYLVSRTGDLDLYYVSEAMGALAAEASESLEKFALAPEDLPSPSGLIIFDGVAPFESEYDDGCKNELRGIAWYSEPDDVSVIGMPIVLPHGDLGRGSRIAIDPGSFFATRYGSDIEELTTPGGAAFEVFGLLLTVWLLMQQPLARSSDVLPDRATRKRLRRIGQATAPIRVIHLRRPEAGNGDDNGSRDYHHQWIVRGHWRNHWHPKREVHRPVWIAPHIKGPEGAPLLGGEKVYAWKR